MKFIDFQSRRLKLNLEQKFQSSNSILHLKETIIIKAIDDKGRVYFAEVSPLPNFSNESIDDVETMLYNIIGNWNELSIDNIEEIILSLDDYPSLKYGFEQLLFSYRVKTSQIGFGLNSIVTNGIVGMGSISEVKSQVQKLINQGFTTIKLKVGDANIYKDLEFINTIASEYNSVNFRIDNNGSWDIEESFEFISNISYNNIEYLEQPVNNFKDLLLLAERSTIPLAGDECIQDYNKAIKYIDSGLFNYIVLKPSIRLGLLNSQKIIEYANIKNVKVIITSAFETIIGRIPLLYLTTLVNHRSAHGLSLPLPGDDTIKCDMRITPLYNFRIDNLFNTFSVKF